MMDQEDDGGIGDTTDEYGELFEGQASGFDRSLSEGDDLNGMGGMTVSSSGGHTDSRMVIGNQIHLFISGGDNGQDQNVVMSTSGEQTNVIDGGGGGFHENVDTTAAGDCSSNLQQNHTDEGNSYQHEEVINDGQEGVRGGGPSWDAEGGEEQYKRIKVEIVKDVEHFGRVNINKYLKQNGYREVLCRHFSRHEKLRKMQFCGLGDDKHIYWVLETRIQNDQEGRLDETNQPCIRNQYCVLRS
jgi:hypothetical protein